TAGAAATRVTLYTALTVKQQFSPGSSPSTVAIVVPCGSESGSNGVSSARLPSTTKLTAPPVGSLQPSVTAVPASSSIRTLVGAPLACAAMTVVVPGIVVGSACGGAAGPSALSMRTAAAATATSASTARTPITVPRGPPGSRRRSSSPSRCVSGISRRVETCRSGIAGAGWPAGAGTSVGGRGAGATATASAPSQPPRPSGSWSCATESTVESAPPVVVAGDGVVAGGLAG